jgi:hypothetical protein
VRRKIFAARRLVDKTDMIECPQAPAAPGKTLTPEAQRALAEAEARRKAQESSAQPRPVEVDGPSGPEPVRYGDWERKGIASDF